VYVGKKGDIIQERTLNKGGHYSRKYGICLAILPLHTGCIGF